MTGIEKKIQDELDEIGEKGQRRSLQQPPGIDLLSNDYLGLAEDERLKMVPLDERK